MGRKEEASEGKSATHGPTAGEKWWGRELGLFTKRSEDMEETPGHYVMGTSKGHIKNGPLQQEGFAEGQCQLALQPSSENTHDKAELHDIL